MPKFIEEEDYKAKKVQISQKRKSSINFQKTKAHSQKHNFREEEPSYLLPVEEREQNEYLKHKRTPKQIFEEELKKAKRKGGRIPKLENSTWEAVLNLEQRHTMEDLKKVAIHIQKKFNITCTSIAIHRDEGFINKKTGFVVRNYHAHLNFMTYKDGRQNWRKEHIKPKDLSQIQTEVAEILGMERGTEGSKARRLSSAEFREFKQTEEELKNLRVQNKHLEQKLEQNRAEVTQNTEKELTEQKTANLSQKELTKKDLYENLKSFKQQKQKPKRTRGFER